MDGTQLLYSYQDMGYAVILFDGDHQVGFLQGDEYNEFMAEIDDAISDDDEQAVIGRYDLR